MTRGQAIGIGIVILVVAGTIIILAAPGKTSESLGQVIARYGYFELRPPSLLPSPGTLVHITSASPVTLRLVCSATDAFGAHLPIATSQSEAADIAQEFGRVAKLDGQYIAAIRNQARYSDVTEIRLSLTNVRIWELSDAVAFRNRRNRTRSCEQATAARKQRGDTVTLITSVIQADVEYFVSFKRDLSNDAKGEITQKLAVELGASGNDVRGQTIRGSGLYWGVIDDLTLASALETARGGRDVAPLPGFARDTTHERISRLRLLRPGEMATVMDVEARRDQLKTSM